MWVGPLALSIFFLFKTNKEMSILLNPVSLYFVLQAVKGSYGNLEIQNFG